MFTLSKSKKRFMAGLVTAAAVGLALCLVSHFDLLHQIRLQSSDFFFKAADSSPAAGRSSPVVIVGIDDATLEKLGRLSSWPRSYHARLIDNLTRDGARVIAFDVLFAEPAPGDEDLAAAMQRAGNVILASAGGGGTAIRPLEQLESNARNTGNAGVVPDADGIVRRLPLLVPAGDDDMPAFSLASLAAYLRRPQPIEAIEGQHLYLAGRSIPIDPAGNMLINYAGGPLSSTEFKVVSYADVLDNNFSAGTFNDKIAIIGATAVGMGDTFWTPMGRMVSGVQLHASAINTILSASFLAAAPSLVTIISILLLSLLAGLCVMLLRAWRAVAATFGMVALYFLAAFISFDRGVMLDLLYPSAAVAAAFASVSLYNVAMARHEKKEIASAFGRYVSPAVASAVLEAVDRDALMLDGEERPATVLFADARGFTRFSETSGPRELAAVLNRYYPVIISTIMRYGGMINKFEGDRIMALWNVPADCPEHAFMAVTAAVAAQRAIRQLQEKEPGLPQMDFGMGVNTGQVMAGNMGSADRLEYSVVGDAVNVAARLTGEAPGGCVWVGQSTYERVEGRVEARALGLLTLKGKLEPVKAYEITSIRAGLPEGAALAFR